jgi:hypothetical protein
MFAGSNFRFVYSFLTATPAYWHKIIVSLSVYELGNEFTYNT